MTSNKPSSCSQNNNVLIFSDPLVAFLRKVDRKEDQTGFQNMDMKESSHSRLSDVVHNIPSVFAAVLYGTCSVLIAFINKLLMTTYEFDFPVFIMMSQMLFTIILLEILSLPFIGLINMPRYTLERGKMFAIPALFYGMNSVLALSALSHMNIALYGVLKRCVPLVTMVMSVLILKKGWPSKLTIGSVVFLTLGCIVAGRLQLYFELIYSFLKKKNIK